MLIDEQNVKTPLYEKLHQRILKRIRNGELKAGQKITLDDAGQMVQQEGVSRHKLQQSLHILATKGLLFRKPRAGTFIRPDFAKANAFADTQSSKNFALVLRNICIPEEVLLLKAFQDEAHNICSDIISANTNDNIETYCEVLRRYIEEKKTAAIFIVPPLTRGLPLEMLLALKQSGIPVVGCYRSISGEAGLWPTVSNDAEYSCYMATKHLLEIGCQRIAHLQYRLREGSTPLYSLLSVNGYLKALLESTSSRSRLVDRSAFVLRRFVPDMLTGVAVDIEDLEKWWQSNQDVDGICCSGDNFAIEVIEFLNKKGKDVPGDIAVTGHGGFAKFLGKQADFLTTMEGSFRGIAKKGLELVERQLAGEHFHGNLDIMVRGELVQGRSSMR